MPVLDLALTPVQTRDLPDSGTVLVKRDDLYTGPGGAIGGKARTCAAIADGVSGLTTACGRSSPQANIVARVGQAMGAPVRIHTPTGEAGPEIDAALQHGGVRVEHFPGHNSVISARARDDAAQRGWVYVPFGMEHIEAVRQTADQLANVPDTGRIVIAVGSGMSAAGIVAGLRRNQRDTRVLGVVVGARPERRLDRFAPDWRDHMDLIDAGCDYHTPAHLTDLDGLELDAIYEAKCLPWLCDGDLLWIVGKRMNSHTE